MLKLTHTDITLGQSADDKFTAIRTIAADLASKGLVEEGYVEGMLNREKQNSTFLGNGIAIPHGTTDTRELVKNTGVTVHHFPQGVDWGDGNTVYVAIGIAAKSDEHLGILKQLTRVLSADGVEDLLKSATTEKEIIALLNGEVQLEAELNEQLIQLNVPASDMTQMAAITAGLLKNAACVGDEYIADIIAKTPSYLGLGLWLVSSNKAVTRTGVAFISNSNSTTYTDKPLKALLTVAACNSAHQNIMNTLSQLIYDNKQEQLYSLDAPALISLLKGEEPAPASDADAGNVAVFKIKNAHGLHARPGAMLVAEAKKFAANIRVVNLNGDGKAVNAKSLMKVIALGVKQGHELQFTADGEDAAQALEAIGKAIDAGLGE